MCLVLDSVADENNLNITRQITWMISDQDNRFIISLSSNRPKGPFPKDRNQDYRHFSEKLLLFDNKILTCVIFMVMLFLKMAVSGSEITKN